MQVLPIPAISDIKDPESVRVVLFINNSYVHTSLGALLKEVTQAIADLETRVSALETP